MTKTKDSSQPIRTRKSQNKAMNKLKLRLRHMRLGSYLMALAVLVFGSVFADKSFRAHAYSTPPSPYVLSYTFSPSTSGSVGGGYSQYTWPVPLDAQGSNPPYTNTGFLTYSVSYTPSAQGKVRLDIYSNVTQQLVASSSSGNPIVLTTPANAAAWNFLETGASVDVVDFTLKITWSPSATASPTPTLKPPVSPTPKIAPKDTTPPTVPAGLQAVATSPNDVKLTWNASTDAGSGVGGYHVYRGSSSANLSLLKDVSSPQFDDGSVNASTKYYYYVTAFDKAGNVSGPSSTVSATTPNAPPPLPTIQISSPSNGATVSNTVNIMGIAGYVAAPLKSVEVEIDNNGFVSAMTTTANTNAENFNYSVNTSLYANTEHTVTAKVTDSAGLTNTASIRLTFKNGNYSAAPPLAQGTWVSPEGMTVVVNSKGKNPHTGQPWTIADAYYMVKACAVGTGDFSTIASRYTVEILDDVGNLAGADDYTVVSAGTSGTSSDKWSTYGGTSYLRGDQGPMLTEPHDVACYEYSHVWTNYYYYIVHYPSAADNLNNSGMTAPPDFLSERWVNQSGSITLAQNNLCNNSVDGWDGCMSDDRRILFGGPGVNGGTDPADQVPGEPDTGYKEPYINYVNGTIVLPQNQPGLADWYKNKWIAGL